MLLDRRCMQLWNPPPSSLYIPQKQAKHFTISCRSMACCYWYFSQNHKPFQTVSSEISSDLLTKIFHAFVTALANTHILFRHVLTHFFNFKLTTLRSPSNIRKENFFRGY